MSPSEPVRTGIPAVLARFRKRARRARRRLLARQPAGQPAGPRPGRPVYDFAFETASTPSRASPYPSVVNHDNLLEQLGDKYQPTKRAHNYLGHYWAHLRDIRLDVKSVLEIGVQTDRSIRMWEEFFPNATIYGMDIDPQCRQFEGDRRRMVIGDQGDVEFLRRVTESLTSPFDVIIDDGSHRVEHQLRTFDYLFPTMSDHGVYIVEDTGGVVGDYEMRTANALTRLVRDIMYWPAGFRPQDWPHLTSFPPEASWSARNIVGIAAYRWIVFVIRGNNPTDNPYLTPLEGGR